MVATVTVSLVARHGGLRPGQSPPVGGGELHCYNFLSERIIQTGVCWPTVAAIHWFATVAVTEVLPFFVCSCPSSIFTGVGGQSGAPNFSLPSIPVWHGCQPGVL